MKSLILFLLATLAAAPAMAEPELALPSKIDCGTYRLKGQFAQHSGVEVLRIYPSTEAEFEVPVLGLPTDQALSLDDTFVTLEVEVFRVRPKDPPRAYFHKILSRSNRHDALEDPAQKLEGRSCGNAPKQ